MTHADAAGKRVWREPHLEAEFVDAFLETPIATEDDLIFKQRRQPVPHVFCASPAASRAQESQVRNSFPGGNRVLEDLDIATEADDYMGDAHRLDDGQENRAFDHIAGEIRAPWVVQINVVIGDVSVALAERGAKLGQKGVAILTGRRGGGLGGEIGGHDTRRGLLHPYKTAWNGRRQRRSQISRRGRPEAPGEAARGVVGGGR